VEFPDGKRRIVLRAEGREAMTTKIIRSLKAEKGEATNDDETRHFDTPASGGG
jgi:hypothetical protein